MSAYEAFDYDYLREGIDEIVVSRAHQLARAKAACLEMSEKDMYHRREKKTSLLLVKKGWVSFMSVQTLCYPVIICPSTIE